MLLSLLAGCAAPGPVPHEAFLVGVNYPWSQYGIDFGSSAWGHFGVSADEAAITADFQELSAHGVRVVRWFVLADGRASPEFDHQGVPVGLDEAFFTDFDAALRIASQTGIRSVPVLLDFHWLSAPQHLHGVQLGGHADTISNPERRAALISRVIEPLLQRYGDHRAILSWEIINEPEWAMDAHTDRLEDWEGDGAEPEDVLAFVEDAAAVIAQHSDHPVTLGSAKQRWMSDYWAEVDLGLRQYHYYERGSFDDVCPEDPVPVLIGEFATADASLSQTLDGIWSGGFSGGWAWSMRAEDDASDLKLDELHQWLLDNRFPLTTPAPGPRAIAPRLPRISPEPRYPGR